MMINGIDLLFVLAGFILLLVVFEVWDRYRNWSEWDRDRRRKRRLNRLEFQDEFIEKQYRTYLRCLLLPGLIRAMHMTTRSFEKFNDALKGNSL